MLNVPFPITADRTAAKPELHGLPELPETVRSEINELRELARLQQALATTLDAESMLRAFSGWIEPHIAHQLIAFRGATDQHHSYFPNSDLDRALAATALQEVFEHGPTRGGLGIWPDGRHVYETWDVATRIGTATLVIVRRAEKPGQGVARLINHALGALRASLLRAVDYEDIYRQARHDSLTGLANRRVFDDALLKLWRELHRRPRPAVIGCIDLNRFKRVNDYYGHTEGDGFLKGVANQMAAALRTTDLLARVGGDEFGLILNDTDLDAARTLADRLRASIQPCIDCFRDVTGLGVSIGLAPWREELSADDWWREADEALYRMKSSLIRSRTPA